MKVYAHIQGDRTKKVASLQRVLSLHRMLNGRKAAPLMGCQLGVPHIHDEDEPERRGILPHLVFKGVIEDEHLAFFPRPGKEKHISV